MEDRELIDMLFDRREEALSAVEEKFSRLYKSVLRNIPANDADIDECGNDCLLAIWNSIPPNRPDSLMAYVARVARNIGINRFKRLRRRVTAGIDLAELEEILPDEAGCPEERWRAEELRRIINSFVSSLDGVTRVLFVRRYFYMESVAELAERFEMAENNVSARLYRARQALKKKLEKEGVRI